MLNSFNIRFYMADTGEGSPSGEQEIDLTQLGQEELSQIEFDESGEIITPETPKTDEPEKDKKQEGGTEPEKKPDETETKDTKSEDEEKKEEQDKSLDDQINEIESVPKEERTKEQVLELRRLHAEKKMHEATQKAAKLLRELEEKNAMLLEMQAKQDQEDDFIPLSPKEEEALKDADPDEYEAYLADKQKFENRQLERTKQSAMKTFTSIVDYYREKKGLSSDKNLDEVANSQEFKDFLQSDELKAVDKFLSANIRPDPDGSYSVEKIKMADRIVNYDNLLSQARSKGREEALSDINKARNSDASRIQKGSTQPGTQKVKKLSELTDQEIINLSKDELEQYEAELRQQGMA